MNAKMFPLHPTLCGPVDHSPPRLLCPWDSPGKNTGVGCHDLLQGIFLTEGWKECLLHLSHWQADSSPRVPPGKDGTIGFNTLSKKSTPKQSNRRQKSGI